jgi:hypothetical protein
MALRVNLILTTMKKKDYHFNKASNGLSKDQELMLVPFIINCVGEYFNVDAGYELLKHRDKVSVYHRYLCTYLINENTQHLSLNTIGEYFNKDHSLIISACNRIKNFLFYDTAVRNDVFSIQDKINIKIENLLKGIVYENDQDYYIINLNTCTSIRIADDKSILGVNLNAIELELLKRIFDATEIKTHTNTGLILCEPKTINGYDRKYEGEKAEGEDSRQSNKRNVN